MDKRLSQGAAGGRCRVAYFFLAGGRSKFDGAYKIRSAKARRALRAALDSGAEVGLHVSYEAGGKPWLIAGERASLAEAARLPVRASRHHYLRFREPEDAAALVEAGVAWDATLGYSDAAGFRLSVCHPIRLFHLSQNRPLEIEEHPLLVMDGTLVSPTAMGLAEEDAWNCTRRIVDACVLHRGEFVALWHNYALAPDHPGYLRRLYRRLLDYLADRLAGDGGAQTARPPAIAAQ
jgi:hypothetical protein